MPEQIKVEEKRREKPTVPSGISVWAVIYHLRGNGGDEERTITDLDRAIDRRDIEYARQYYEQNKEEIDKKIQELES